MPEAMPAAVSDAPVLDVATLRREGYVLLRGAIPADWLDGLRADFDANVRLSHEWPVPRGPDWRHSLLDLEPRIQAVCRLPQLLEAAGALIGERFFIAQVEGREPLPDGGHQGLHRDLSDQRPGDTVSALAFFDDYGAWNGATRLVPGSHREPSDGRGFDAALECRALQLEGRAGDVLVFDADLVHAGSVNRVGARRRSILIGYFAESRRAGHQATAALRGVRMDTRETFEP
jgi:hypothetical protein